MNLTLNEDEPTLPERIWHVDGILAPFDKSTTLDGSRVTYATTETAAAEKVVAACRSARGGEWGWLGLVRIYPHYAWDDPDCPVCKRRDAITHCHEGDCPNMAEKGTRYCEMHLASNHRTWAAIANDLNLSHEDYQDGIDALYEPAIYTPTTLTDARAGYDVPSEAALAFAERVQKACLLDVNLYDLLQDDVARLLDEYAAQAVAKRDAEIVEGVERYLAGCHKSQETARQIGYLESAARYDTEIAAYETTIAIVKREL